MRRNQGCLSGILQMFLLERFFNFMQGRFGFGRGCTGAGCGVIMLIVFVVLACSIFSGTNWTQFGF